MDGLRELFGEDITRLESRYEEIAKTIQVSQHGPTRNNNWPRSMQYAS